MMMIIIIIIIFYGGNKVQSNELLNESYINKV